MLRITPLPQSDVVTLKLEGKLLEPWCDELRLACRQAMESRLPVQLDLFDVSFVDRPGAELLRALERLGVTVSRASSFVAELLHIQPERI